MSDSEIVISNAHLQRAAEAPRDPLRQIREIQKMATADVETAEACFYERQIGKDMVRGPSVRLAELVAWYWGNLRVDTRTLPPTRTEAVARALVVDLERNNVISHESRRSIVGKRGRFPDSLITTTGQAAASVAFREAIFKAVPRVLIDPIWQACRDLAVAAAQGADPSKALQAFEGLGVSRSDLLRYLGASSIGANELVSLRNLYQQIKRNEICVDDIVDHGTELSKAAKE